MILHFNNSVDGLKKKVIIVEVYYSRLEDKGEEIIQEKKKK
jgi:hypothetical protein